MKKTTLLFSSLLLALTLICASGSTITAYASEPGDTQGTSSTLKSPAPPPPPPSGGTGNPILDAWNWIMRMLIA